MLKYPSILEAQHSDWGIQMVVPYEIKTNVYHQNRPDYIYLEKNLYKSVRLTGEAHMVYKGVIVGIDYDYINYIINFIYQDEKGHEVPGLWLVHPENPGLSILNNADDELYKYVASLAGIASAKANDPNAKADFKVQGLKKISAYDKFLGKKANQGLGKPILQGSTADIIEALNLKRASSSKAEGKTRRKNKKGKKTKRR